ncbi:MAG: DegT/DnrJ/EryC1/StrS family aminotransferase [Burkholderiales bacterium]|nr:DegT/DnrJ/EryC1/StrS family aminotransferase [Burkholderiales bacterium]
MAAPDLAEAPAIAEREATAPDEWLLLSEPDHGPLESEFVQVALRAPRWSAGPMTERFERAFAQRHGRAHGVAVTSGTVAAWLALRALGIGAGDEVIASAYAWQPVAHAVTLAGARVVFADIDYWSGCIDPARAAAQVTPATRALIAGNINGHPAAWSGLRALAQARGLALIEDSTEALGSRYAGRPVGSFGDMSVFDFSAPSALCCGEGAMLLTDDDALAHELRGLRAHGLEERRSVSVGARVPLQARLSEISAALGLAQLARLDDILARRQEVAAAYHEHILSFEGIKPPYVAPGVDEVHWMLYVIHLGKRFTASACAQIVDDLRTECIEAALYSRPLHQQHAYAQQGWRRGQLPLAERIADRALALPLHGGLQADHVRFIVQTLKDSSINVGAGAAIY